MIGSAVQHFVSCAVSNLRYPGVIGSCGSATGEVSAALMVQVFRVVTLRDRGIRYRYFEGTYQIIIKYSFHRASWHSSATLTEIFPCFFLSCKANARV